MQEKQQKRSEADLAIINKYGDGRKFAETFNPDLQKVCSDNIERSFTGDAPTIAALRNAYSTGQVQVWILAQIENLNQYAGTKSKMNPSQMEMLADVIIREYCYLKATELLLFFFQFKAGKYGQLYGSVDPMKVSSALKEFTSYRREMTFTFEKYQERKDRTRSIQEWKQKNSDRKK